MFYSGYAVSGRFLLCVNFLLALLFAGTAFAMTSPPPTSGQTVYVPVYSNVFSGDKALPFNLANTLSIRNTDPQATIRVLAADYHDSDGKLLREYYEKPVVLGPLASTSIFIREKDTEGGFGAHFIVRWQADAEVNQPIIECVMIGARGGQGISFVSPGQVLHEKGK